MPLGGGSPTTLGAGLPSPFGVAVGASTVYFTSFWGGAVMTMPVTGGLVTTLISGQESGTTGIGVNTTGVYWNGNDTSVGGGATAVERMPVAAGASTVLVDGQNDPMGVAVDGSSAYAGGIAVNATSLYWTTEDTNNVGSLMRLAK
jgi:hypothetical protein